MNYVQASDDYLMYLEVEKNYSLNTLTSYAFDLKLYGEFLTANNRSLDLDELISSSVRRFVQDQVHHNIVISQERYNAAFRA
ncbi:site-specific integrase [Bacillus sp. R1-10]